MDDALAVLRKPNRTVKTWDETFEEDVAKYGAIVGAISRIDDDRRDEETPIFVLHASQLPVLSSEVMNSAAVEGIHFPEVASGRKWGVRRRTSKRVSVMTPLEHIFRARARASAILRL